MQRYDLLIINRSFWPIYPIIGESLLRLAENLAFKKKIGVVMQDHANIKKKLKLFNRGQGVNFFSIWAKSNSSSSIFKRIIDSLLFMIWVLACLIWTRPKKIYIATDPPVIVPFIVAIYSKLFKANFFYHLQDIHPESANVSIKINYFLFKLLKKIDVFTIRQANLIFTLNQDMKLEIIKRSKIKKKILILENPSIFLDNKLLKIKKLKGFSFTGNLGRQQRIPLLLEAIEIYINKGGKLEFNFAGGGVYSDLIHKLSKSYSSIKYHGIVSAEKAGLIVNNFEWALLPIEDKTTKYSFPSKSSTYACSGSKILAICGDNTSVSKWVKINQLGFVVPPVVSELVDTFYKIEKEKLNEQFINIRREDLKKKLNMDLFVEKLKNLIFPELKNV